MIPVRVEVVKNLSIVALVKNIMINVCYSLKRLEYIGINDT